jgi:hypothetical protein
VRKGFSSPMAGSLVAVGICLSGCTPHSVERSYHDVDGIPTYEARTRIEPWEQAEGKALDLILQHCPDGEPEFVRGHVLTQDVMGRQLSVVFTCNDLIPGT